MNNSKYCPKCKKKVTPSLRLECYNSDYDIEIYCPFCYYHFYDYVGVINNRALDPKRFGHLANIHIPKGDSCGNPVDLVLRIDTDENKGEELCTLRVYKKCPYWEFRIKDKKRFKKKYIGEVFNHEIATAYCNFLGKEDTCGILWDGIKICGVNT